MTRKRQRPGKTSHRQKKDLHVAERRRVVPVATGQPKETAGVRTKVTGRKTREDEVAVLRQRLSSFFAGATAGLALLDGSLRYVQVNNVLAEMNGLPARDHVGKTVREVVPSLAPLVEPMLRKVLATGEPVLNLELTGETPSRPGIPRHWAVSLSPVAGTDGSVHGVGIIVVEVTEWKGAEQALLESESKYRRLHESIVDASAAVDMTGRILESNPAYQQMLGYSAEELEHLAYTDLTPEKWHAFHDRVIEREVLPKGYSDVYQKEYRRKDGTVFPVELRTSLIRDDAGRPAAMRVVVRDITERQQAAQALREREELLRQLTENIRVVLWLSSTDWRQMFYVSPAYEDIWGRRCDSLLRNAADWLEAMHPEDRPRIEAGYTRDPGGPFTGTYRIVRPDGTSRWILERGFPVRDELGTPYRTAGMAEDITERRRTEDALLEANRSLRELIATSPLAIIAMDRDGVVRVWNQAATTIFGWSEEEAVGKALPIVPPDEQADFHRLTERELEGDHFAGLERRRQRKDGTSIDVQLWTASVRNVQGEITGSYAMFVDVTEHKRARVELETSREALRALTARLEAVREQERERLAREIHDTFGHALTEWKFDLAWLERKLAEAGIGGRRAVRRRIFAMSRRAEAEMETVRRIASDLRPALLDAFGLTAAIEWQASEFKARTGIRCQLALAPGVSAVDSARSTALFRILQEALSNVARHANATAVEIQLTVGGGSVELVVRDNGCGISEASARSQAALGLLGMRERAMVLGGEVSVKGVQRGGTTLTARLPLEVEDERDGVKGDQ